MALTVANCTPGIFSFEGGGLALVTGVFPQAPLTLSIAPQTAVTGVTPITLYGGIAGQGSVIQPLGQNVRVIFPRVPVTVPIWVLTVSCPSTGESGVCPVTLSARTPFYNTTTYAIRSLYAPVWATGPRTLTDEAFPWQP